MHEPSTKRQEHESAVIIKEIIGKWFFLLYAIVYTSFILINIFNPSFMGIDIGGLNMAIVFGFGLILLAILLAFAYNHISTRTEQLLNKDENEEKILKEGGSNT